MLGVRYNLTRLNNNSTNVNYNVNKYYNNGGGSSTMSKKYSKKLNSYGAGGVSNNTNFSINGNSNHYYIGNPNSNFSHDPFSNVNKNSCIVNNKNNMASVKNTKGLLQTRIHNNTNNGGIKCNPVNSFQCYKSVNQELIQRYNEDVANNVSNPGLNKHFRNENRDASSKIEKSKCFVDRTNYRQLLAEQVENDENNSNTNIATCKKCVITKDLTAVNSYVVGYDVYLTRKKTGCSNLNPRDAKVIAC